MQATGTIEAYPASAQLNRSTPKEQSNDTLVQFTLGSKSYKSQVSKGRGANPVWSDVVKIPLKGEGDMLKVSVMDKGFFSAKEVGFANIPIAEVIQNGAIDRTVPLMGPSGPVGALKLGLNHLPPGRRTPATSPSPQMGPGVPGIPYGMQDIPIGEPMTSVTETTTHYAGEMPQDVNIYTPSGLPIGGMGFMPPMGVPEQGYAGINNRMSASGPIVGPERVSLRDMVEAVMTPHLAPDPSD